MHAAIYARYSTDLQSAASIEDQTRQCREKLESDGLHLISTYSDRAISGASMLRPGIQALLEDAGKGRFSVVYAEALDRMSRDQADVASIYKHLCFSGIRLITLSEGEISELHVGLKGTMNALFLKDLADKTRRGLKGRVLAGRSAGGVSYGYDVIHEMRSDGTPIRGGRKINLDEAAIVHRIFEEYSTGNSPIKIARTFNEENIPGPRGELWRDTAIRGHRIRGTGILNNELYIGKLVWNRLRYVKDPTTGKRVSRRNSEDKWVIEQVPDLRIIDDHLWEAVKARQEQSDAQPHIQKIKASCFWEHRRAPHLLSGLIHCGHCQGKVVVVGRGYLACSNARKLKTCTNNRSITRTLLEDKILNALKKQLMQPECVKVFMATYHQEVNRKAALVEQQSGQNKKELEKLKRKHTGLINAIADGLRTQGLKSELEALETKIGELEEKLRNEEKAVLRLHPNLANLYQEKVANLHEALESPDSRQQALDIIRGLIEKIIIHESDKRQEIELIGDIARMVEVAHSAGQNEELLRSSTKVVAGVGFWIH